jgi:nitroreductase
METKTLFNGRRSVNHFDTTRSIDDNLLKEIVNLSETVVMIISLGYFDSSKQLYPRRPRRSFHEITSII